MIDFSLYPKKNKTYAGANGSKICVMYEEDQYMLKFPAPPSRNQRMSYTNGCLSEYIGCHIFESIGFSVQKTLLGIYRYNGKEKIVVACKDFTSPGIVLQDFASLKNTVIDSEHNGYGTELSDIMNAIEEQTALNPYELREWFWDMFIVDALIGNWDRHNGNWGFLYDTRTDKLEKAPIYDCGSCLFPQADDMVMKSCIDDQDERDLRIFQIPLSGIKINGSKINYYDFISSLEDKDCNEALKRINSKIDLARINRIIDETPFITDLQKQFYKTMLKERKEKILDVSYEKLYRREHNKKSERSECRR